MKKSGKYIFCGIVALAIWAAVYSVLGKFSQWATYSLMGFEKGEHLSSAVEFFIFLFLSVNEMQARFDRKTQVLLLCAIAGLMIHNLIDFAIFEPGVYTAWWAIIAAIAAMDLNQGGRREFTLRPSQLAGSAAVVGGFVLMWVYVIFCVMPVLGSTLKVHRAASVMQKAIQYADANSTVSSDTRNNILQGMFGYVNGQLWEAASADRLNPAAPAFNAEACIEFYKITGQKDENLLTWAHNRLLAAIKRDEANFKHYEKLAELMIVMADRLNGDEQIKKLTIAHNAISEAIRRYPGSERLRMLAGRIAERRGQKEDAIERYKKAVEIEDSYRVMFVEMYPGKPIFSRMGEGEYKFAKDRIQVLSK